MNTEKNRYLDQQFISSELFVSTIKSNPAYYKVVFKKIAEEPENMKAIVNGNLIKKQKSRFNWPAAVFGPLWYAYRKMWRMAFLLLAISIALFTFIDLGSSKTSGFGNYGLMLIVAIFWMHHIGSYANSAYFRFMQLILHNSNEDAEVELYAGTSWTAVAVVLVIEIIAQTILSQALSLQ